MNRLRAVLFDVDDTLVDHQAAQRAGIEAQLAILGQPVDETVHARWKMWVDASFARYLAGSCRSSSSGVSAPEA